MKTKILESTKENIAFAARVIKEGGLVAFPTETVYGLGADALNEEAVKKIYRAKGRPSDNPMICHISSIDDMSFLADDVNAKAEKLMRLFSPGPITVIVRKSEAVPLVTSGGLDTVGVRLPDNDIARALIKEAGVPIAAPSANLSGKPSPTKVEHVVEDMDGKVDVILKGEDCRVGIESTVIDTTGKELMILRPGMVTAKEISQKMEEPVIYDLSLNKAPEDGDFAPKAPGMKYKHYAPKGEMRIFEGSPENVKAEIERQKKEAVKKGIKADVILFEADAYEEAAHDFFAKLREMDLRGVELIFCGGMKMKDDVGFAVMNRMLKSAGYNIIKV